MGPQLLQTMTDIIPSDRSLPVNPTAADTSNWYRLGDAVEKHGRHMKRQAVAAEYNSGRNMAAWCRELGTSEGTMREILTEARNLELVGDAPFVTTKVSAALPTQAAAREYAKAEPEVREVIKEIIKEDPEAEIKAAEIKRLRQELTDSREDAKHLRSQLNQQEVQDIRVQQAIDSFKSMASHASVLVTTSMNYRQHRDFIPTPVREKVEDEILYAIQQWISVLPPHKVNTLDLTPTHLTETIDV